MAKLGDIAQKIRSKNAGPFWLTVDVFCGTAEAYQQVASGLSTARVATTYGVPLQTLKRFDIADLNVIKFSFPRPSTQGAVDDRDLHGASWSVLLRDIEI